MVCQVDMLAKKVPAKAEKINSHSNSLTQQEIKTAGSGVLLQFQYAGILGNIGCGIVLWDNGSTVNLIRKEFADEVIR